MPSAMRIVIDARPAVAPRRTGVGYYTWHLVRRLPEVDPANAYVAWYLNAGGFLRGRRFFADVAAPNLAERGTPIPAAVFNRLDSRLDLPRLEWFVRFDVAFGPNFVLPPTRARRAVVTVHDLGFRLLPPTAPHVVPWWLRRLEATLRTASRVVVPSEATKRDVAELYGTEPERIEVVPLGVDAEVFRPPSSDEVGSVRRRFGIDGPYVVFLGLERRKNLAGLLEAVGRLPANVRPTVVLAGARPWDPYGRDHVREALEGAAADVRRRVVATGYVSDRTKAALLGGAEALAYPSLYEGFGLPVLEAMACGAPVLASDVAALPELVDGAGVLVDPADPDAIAAGLASILTDDDLRARLRSRGAARAASYTWDATARRTARVLHAAGG
jgi:glycosyltransferase involved in cell wall biosynthesis